MEDFFITIIGFLFMFFLGFFVVAFFQGHFFFKYLQVKASRGKKILCKIRTPTRDYFRVGVPSEKTISVKFLGDKLPVTLVFNNDCIYRAWGVNVVDIDEQSREIIDKNFELKPTFDHPTLSNIMKRIITAPSINDKLVQIILILSILILLAVIVGFFILKNDISKLVDLVEVSRTVGGVNL